MRETDRQTGRQAGRQTDRYRRGWGGGETDRQTRDREKERRDRDRERQRERERERDKIILYYTGIKIEARVGFFANLSLMTNTATLNTSNKNSLKYAREKTT